ncbi:Uncharacterised protein [Bordetella pertussis]|nr:Uncharacterised protein [Bordetella pertussis]
MARPSRLRSVSRAPSRRQARMAAPNVRAMPPATAAVKSQ